MKIFAVFQFFRPAFAGIFYNIKGNQMKFTNAYSEKTKNSANVIYKDDNGRFYKYSGGTPAWRNNNPGNIIQSPFANANGAIGNSQGFAVFPDPETGKQALHDLLLDDKYQKLSIGAAITAYAPPHENNTEAYKKFVQNETGLPLDTSMKGLSEGNLQRVMNAIMKIEGTKPGKVEALPHDAKFIWHTVGDEKVRPEHEEKDGEIFCWCTADELPGDGFNCRCYAEEYQ